MGSPQVHSETCVEAKRVLLSPTATPKTTTATTAHQAHDASPLLRITNTHPNQSKLLGDASAARCPPTAGLQAPSHVTAAVDLALVPAAITSGAPILLPPPNRTATADVTGVPASHRAEAGRGT